MFKLLVVIWVFCLADLVCTIEASIESPFIELNPLAAQILNHHHFWWIVLFKISATWTGCGILWYLRKHLSAQIGAWLIILTYLGLMFRWFYFWCY